MTPVDVKERLRGALLVLRRSLSLAELERLSSMVQRRFVQTTEFREARTLALYSSFHNEVLTDHIAERALAQGKEVFFPRVVKGERTISFYRVNDKKELCPGSYGIPEPPAIEGRKIEPESIECVVVPGIAFDTRGTRVGYGRGCYDITLATAKHPVVALAFDFQVVHETIPAASFDVLMDAVVTESRLLRF